MGNKKWLITCLLCYDNLVLKPESGFLSDEGPGKVKQNTTGPLLVLVGEGVIDMFPVKYEEVYFKLYIQGSNFKVMKHFDQV